MVNTVERVEIALLAASAADDDRVAELMQQLGLPRVAPGIDPLTCEHARAVLIANGLSLSLQQTGKGAPGPVLVDFASGVTRHRSRSSSSELLGKAVGQAKKSSLRVVDATAGLGRDAFVLADMGCEVILSEREPLIAELLGSGLRVALDSGDPWLLAVVGRLSLCPGDARTLPAATLAGVNVIYMDPMFPARTKSAAVKKEMALFQRLLKRDSDGPDADELLHWALAQDVARVVVKRPAKAPNLAALQPSHCISGKSVRYDVYVRRKLV